MKSLSKNTIVTIILIITALLSFFVLAKVASSPDFHHHTIESLDETKLDVMELTTATAAASMAISAVPSDITTPIANQMTQLSTYLLIVVCAVFVEKFLLTVTGYLTFAILVPVACLLFILYVHKKNEVAKALAIKLLSFGLAIFMVIPVSVQVSNIINNTFKLQNTIELAKSGVDEIEKETKAVDQQDDNKITQFFNNAKDTITNTLSSFKKKAETLFNNFIDAIAALIITSCIIPIGVIFFFLWIVKIIFGVNIKIPKSKKTTQTAS